MRTLWLVAFVAFFCMVYNAGSASAWGDWNWNWEWDRYNDGGTDTSKDTSGTSSSCVDMDLSSDGYQFYSVRVDGCRQVTAMTLNKQVSLTKCEFGKTYGFDGNKVFATGGCRGNFRVCYQQEEATQLESQSSGEIQCKEPFANVLGHCITVERNTRKKYSEAVERCGEAGGRLISLSTENLIGAAGAFGNIDLMKGRKFFVGGVTDIDAFVQSKVGVNIATRFRISSDSVKSACGRFSSKASISDLNFGSALSQKCLALDFDETHGPTVVDCDDKLNYICESVPEDNDAEGRWSTWVSAHTLDRYGDEEEFRTVSREALKRNIAGLRLCKYPVAMQCRAIGTSRLYSKDNTYGLRLDSACEKNKISCRNSRQDMGVTCPDFEVRFKCADDGKNDCAVESVRKDCERKRMECVQTPFGAQCQRKKRERTGKEVIGQGTCNMNSMTYTVKQCYAWGDPHYSSFDGKKFDFQGECTYNFATTCGDYVPTDEFPEFSIVVMNIRENPEDQVTVTRAFNLNIAGYTYSFTRGGFTTATGLARSPVDFSDDIISIEADPKGNSYELTINTQFCMTIQWDNRHSVYLNVPDHYSGHMCGLCGNYDGNPDNDMTLPGSTRQVDAVTFGSYHTVGGQGVKGCVDLVTSPKPCSDEEMRKYSDNLYCGIFNPRSGSPFVQAVLEGSETAAIEANKEKLDAYYKNCIMDHCWMENFEPGRCHVLEQAITDMRTQLCIDDPELDTKWRSFANCQDTPETTCSAKPNMVYSSSYLKRCQNSCANPDKDLMCTDLTTSQGCVCKEGFLLDAQLNCVAETECEKVCNVLMPTGENVVLNDGDSVVVEPCRMKMTCQAGEAVQSELDACSEHGECSKDGLSCSCRMGFVGDGHTCTPNRACRDGYYSYGTKCYKLVRDKLDWHSAAINCGADGAQLARYDTDSDQELESFFNLVPQLTLQSLGRQRSVYCRSGNECSLSRGELAVSVKCRDSRNEEGCENGYSISEDRRHISVGANCNAREFIVVSIDARLANIDISSLEVWIGGNTDVLGPNKRDGKPPLQVDPPRLVDMSVFQNSVGCFQASVNDDGEFIVSPNPDCKAELPSICEYDNSNQNKYDPLDLIVIPQYVNQQDAIAKCEEKGRTLAVLTTKAMLDKAKKLLYDSGNDGWLGCRYQDEKYQWNNGLPLDFQNFRRTPVPVRFGREYNCVSMSRRTGYWEEESCDARFFPLCGPPVDITPTGYTPFFPVVGFTSLNELKGKLQREQKQDFICQDPSVIECSAKNYKGVFVDNENQQGQTITCRKDRFFCKSGQELDCSTFRIRLLCPQEENQCQELPRIGATPCDGGRTCYPIVNHYICKCPPGSQYNEHTETCAMYCGECSLWGDPHYTAYPGPHGPHYYDFQGECKYQFTGVCDQDEFKTSPNFDIYTKNKKCGDTVSCLNEIEIHLRNLPVIRSGAQVKENFVFVFRVGASEYALNDKIISQTEYEEKKVYSAVVKRSYFSLIVYALDLTVLVSDTKLKVNVPGTFRDKMCGLCGDCGTDLFRLKNGTLIEPGVSRNGRWDDGIMAYAASQFAVFDATAQTEECKVPESTPVAEECSQEMQAKLEGSTLCGVFIDETSPINACFVGTDIDRMQFYSACMVDACMQSDPQTSVCTMVKAFAQECLSRGITLDWRSGDFCPYTCESGKMYRVDASCEPTCGQSLVSQTMCDEEPEEGCVCPDGKMRQGDECVDPEECGCKIYLHDDTVIWNLPPGESMIMPECVEKVTCSVEEDGTTTEISEPFTLHPYAICSPDVPVTIKCAKGFVMAADGVTCEKDPDGCIEGFMDEDGLCIKVPADTMIWRQAAEACNEADGTLVLVDTDGKLESLKNVMIDQGYTSLYISGKVRAFNDDGNVRFESVLSNEEADSIEWANFAVHASILEKIVLTNDIAAEALPAGGRVFSLVARLSEDIVIVVAVRSDTPSNFVCEQRNVDDEDTKWYGPCNTDQNMLDDGDQENRYDMIMDPTCEVCPVPMDVRCEKNPNGMGEGTVDGTCQLGGDGLYYSCNEGIACIDKGVSTKCAKDADECATNRHDCPANSVCVNTIGGYICRCSDDFPLMVDGQCEESLTCTMSGPETPLDYVYSLDGFSDVPGIFDYDCLFKLAYLCDEANYDPVSGMPYIAVYVMSTRNAGALQPYLAGAIYDPVTDVTKRWALTPDLLAKGRILYGPEGVDLIETSLSFPDRTIRTRFQFVHPGTLVFRHFKNYFKVTISFPTRIQMDFSQEYRNMLCGACTLEPDVPGAQIVLSDDERKELSVMPSTPCSSRTPTTPAPVTTEAPVSTPAPVIPEEPVSTPAPVIPEEPVSTPAPGATPDNSCSERYVSVCVSLNLLCSVPLESCKADLCGGAVEICSYLATGTFQSCILGADLKAFVDLQMCDGICGPNMRFKYTVRSAQPTCSDPYMRPTMTESADDDYTFACVCNEGFVLSGTQCVRITNCGCSMPDRYAPPGSQWRSENCSQIYTCLGNNNLDTEDSPCGSNTECVNTERGPTCQCLDDYYGNPDMPAGCQEGVQDPSGSKFCYEYQFSDGSSETRCECNMGFVSNCGDCEDIDECQEGIHECDLSIQACVNVPGGYECACREGYRESRGKCVNINECRDSPTGLCGPHQSCVDTPGSYECVCCTGYDYNPETDVCDRDIISFPELPENAPCCALCNKPQLCEESLVNPVPYCHFDVNGMSHQYPSYLAMYQDLCLNQEPINDYLRGTCPPEGAPAPGSGPAPALPTSCDDPTLCDALPAPPSSLAAGEVCGPANAAVPQTYPSYCDMVRAVCKTMGGPGNLPSDSYIMASPGPCSGTGPGGPVPQLPPAEPIFTPWSQFSPCQFNNPLSACGEGYQIRNRQVAPYDDGRLVRQVESFEISETRPCFEPCPEDLDPGSGTGCPDPAFCNEVDPVCGSIGYGSATTYNSLCELNVFACLNRRLPHKLYSGDCNEADEPEHTKFCETGPVLDSVKYDVEKDGAHCIGQVVSVGSCGNLLCEGESGTCCKAKNFEKIQVVIDCFSLDTHEKIMEDKHIYFSATECECQTNSVSIEGRR